METKTMVRLDENDGPRYTMKRVEETLIGVAGLGTAPSADVFLRRVDETDDDVSRRILNRLTNGDWVDEEFLTVARDWVVSVHAGLLARDWAALGAPERDVEHLTANDIARAAEVDDVIEMLDEMLGRVRGVDFLGHTYIAARHRAAGSGTVHFGPFSTIDEAGEWCAERALSCSIIAVAPPSVDTSTGAPIWG